jgi:hypothetical protein
MNKRIKELAEQAELEFYEGDDGVPYMCGTQDALKEFAEAIVRECANVALREDHDPYECIKKHFGIKE